MKRLVYTIGLVMALVLTSCGELERSDNGALDGNWQLMTIDTLATNGTKNMKSQKLFWAVQFELLQIKADKNYYFHFEQTDQTLTLKSAAQYGEDLYTLEQLRPLGINEQNECFGIDKLNGSEMILRSSLLRLTFRKY